MSSDQELSRLADVELRRRLEYQEKTQQSWEAGKSNEEPHQRLLAWRHAAGGPFICGILRILLGDTDVARKNFHEAAEGLAKVAAMSQPPDVISLNLALEAAVLSGDWDLAKRSADQPVDDSQVKSFEEFHKTYILALPRLLQEDSHSLSSIIHSDKPCGDQSKVSYPGFEKVLESIISGNNRLLLAGLTSMISWHHARAKRRGSQIWNSPHSFVCVPATVLTAVSLHRGMERPEDLPQRKVMLKNLLVISAKKCDGELLAKGTRFDLPVDYIPSSLISV